MAGNVYLYAIFYSCPITCLPPLPAVCHAWAYALHCPRLNIGGCHPIRRLPCLACRWRAWHGARRCLCLRVCLHPVTRRPLSGGTCGSRWCGICGDHRQNALHLPPYSVTHVPQPRRATCSTSVNILPSRPQIFHLTVEDMSMVNTCGIAITATQPNTSAWRTPRCTARHAYLYAQFAA